MSATTRPTNYRIRLSLVIIAMLLFPAGQACAASGVIRVLVVPVHEAKLSSQLSARVTAIEVKSGEQFHQGDTLIRFDCAIHQAELAKSKAEYKSAQARLASNKKLRSLGSGSALDLAVARAELEKAAAERARARKRVSQCQVAAPFDGRVNELFINRFESVREGDDLADILNDRQLRLEMFVPSDWLRWLKPGTPFDVQIGETGKTYAAKISMIGARVDPVSQSIALHGEIIGDAADLLAGMSGTASFAAANR